MIRRPAVLAAGVVTGVLAGLGIAVAVPDTRTDDGRAATPAAGSGTAPAVAAVRRVARGRTTPRTGSFGRLRATGPVQIAVRLADPRGGPDWAVRSFLGERLTPAGEPARVIGRNRCVQLGRLYRGRFGWLDGRGTFRPVGIDLVAGPTQCRSRRPDMGGAPFGELRFTITDPAAPVARRLQGVVWGLAGRAAGAPSLRAGGGRHDIARGSEGELLGLLAARTDPATVQLGVTYPRRGTVPVIPERRGLPPKLFGGRPFPMARPGAISRLVAQAPDPDGGLPFGVATVAAVGGGRCIEGLGGRVVDGLLGRPDYGLDTFTSGPNGGGSCPGPRSRRPAGRPPFALSSSSGGGSGLEPGEDPVGGRVARRTPEGRTVISGTADPEVASLTLATPLDVRTLVPAGSGRAFITVYGGAFPTGDLVVTTRFRDGRTRRDRIPLGL